jgi:hypothetical protein
LELIELFHGTEYGYHAQELSPVPANVQGSSL